MSIEWDGLGLSPMLFSKTATGAVNTWQTWVEDDYVCTHWGQQDGVMQSSRVRCVPKNDGRSNATNGNEQAIKEAAAKWVKKIKQKYSTGLETAGKTKRIKPMLALDITKRKKPIEYPVTIQPKLDGVRCLAYRMGPSVVLQSRGGGYYDVEHIRSELEPLLQPGVILDGELYLHGVSLQTITSLARRPQIGSEELCYCLYDITNSDHSLGTWRARAYHLFKLFETYSTQLRRVVSVLGNHVHSKEEVLKLQQAFVEAGYEGGIVRTYDGIYEEDRRSPDLLKVKGWEDAEYRIIGWTVGKGKFEKAVVFTCITSEGKEFKVVPTGTKSERYEMLKQAPKLIGQILKMKYLGFTDDGAPKCARAVAIRYSEDM